MMTMIVLVMISMIVMIRMMMMAQGVNARLCPDKLVLEHNLNLGN